MSTPQEPPVDPWATPQPGAPRPTSGRPPSEGGEPSRDTDPYGAPVGNSGRSGGGQPYFEPGSGDAPLYGPPGGAPGSEPYGAPGDAPPYGAPAGARPSGAPPYGGQGAPYGGQYAYGAPQQQFGPAYGALAPARANNGLGTAALILGILAVVLGVVLIGALFGMVAIVLGIVGHGRARRGQATNGGAALAGALLGGLGVLIAAGVIATVLSVFAGPISDYRQCIDRAGSDVSQQETCNDDLRDRLEDRFR